MTLARSSSPAFTPGSGRDGRIDMLRGLSLMMIFIDHIPYNSLSNFTLRAFGFSDAAEIFVFLAGYSAFTAYGKVFGGRGAVAGWSRIGRRCGILWGTHSLLLLGSLAIVELRQNLTGHAPTILAPLLNDGLAGILRGVTMRALPAYLDILPLYIVLLALFPAVLAGLRFGATVTVACSSAVYLGALWLGWNLPNQIDARAAATVWTFNPFAWQFVFTLGVAMAYGRGRGWPWLAAPPRGLTLLCLAILGFGLLAVDPWHLWPALAERLFPRAALDDGWKCTVAPWRVLHSLALVHLLLHSHGFTAFSQLETMQPLKACGRFSLPIFAAGCILALLGRIAFADLGHSPGVQLVINIGGIALQLGFAAWLARGAAGRPARAPSAAPVPPGSVA